MGHKEMEVIDQESSQPKKAGKKHQRRNSLGRATNTQEFMINGASAISSMGSMNGMNSMNGMGSAKSMNGANGHNGSNGVNGSKAASTMSKNSSMGMSEGDQWKDESQVQVYETVEEAQRPGTSENQGASGQGGEAQEGMRDLEQEFKEADEKMQQLRQTMSSASLQSSQSTGGSKDAEEEVSHEGKTKQDESEKEEEEVQLMVYDRLFGGQEFDTENLVIQPVNYDVMVMATKLFPEPVVKAKA
jgi:hypothetical protein